jgi:ComF family protein
MRFFVEKLLPFVLPSQCHCCDRPLEEGKKGFCADCFSQIRRLDPPFCSVCGAPFPSREVENHPCGECVTKERYFSMARALGYYEGPLQEAIHRWKYRGMLSLTSFFGEWMADALRRHWGGASPDILLPVPLHKHRLRERGFNQALLLAQDLSRRTGIPCGKRILRKEKPTLPQVNLGSSEREKGVRGAFQMTEKDRLKGKSILLVDDVYTTGATVNECSKVLIAGGAERVDVLTLAHAIKRS